MKYKTMVYAALPAVLGLSLLVSGNASAMSHGFGAGAHAMVWAQNPDQAAAAQQARFESAATILGITVAEVKDAWAQGKTMQQLAKEKGVTAEQLRTRALEQHRAQVKTQLQTLVSKGIITQAQADARLKVVQAQWTKMDQNFAAQKDKKVKKTTKGDEMRKGGMRGEFGGLHF